MTHERPLPTLAVAAALALGPALSLGLARFSYALLLPPMRADLGWSYLTAGAMNTVNAAGYLVGALAIPATLARFGARETFLAGAAVTALALLGHGVVLGDAALYAVRFVAGVGSAATFVAGGVLAARLVTAPAAAATLGSRRGVGLVLGVYYGGTGLGIVASALVVPGLAGRDAAHAWQGAWIGLAVVAAIAGGVAAVATRELGGRGAAESASDRHARVRWRALVPALAAYFLFGLGYIGYMTFVISLLREARLGDEVVVAFFVVLGVAVIASSWLWAGLLQRARGGGALALLNALLAAATLLPVLSAHPLAVFASGLLFGAVFLSVVASTTALVRHNLAPAAWAAGISGFTIVFAAGQIVGPSAIGLVADRFGGLGAGFASSAGILALAAIVAVAQRELRAA